MSSEPTVIIFDFDGVILESVHVKAHAFSRLFEHHPDHVEAIVELHLRLLAHTPDTLIARKAGPDAAARVSAGAREVLAGRQALQSFDASLRKEGNRLNPGTTADLVTATVFVALVEGILAPSYRVSHSS